MKRKIISVLIFLSTTYPSPVWRVLQTLGHRLYCMVFSRLKILNRTFCNNKKIVVKILGIQIAISSPFMSSMFALFWLAKKKLLASKIYFNSFWNFLIPLTIILIFYTFNFQRNFCPNFLVNFPPTYLWTNF